MMFRVLVIICFALLARQLCYAQTAELVLLEGVRLVDHPANDGDSFRVAHDGREFPVRLYFVDCPETSADSETDARRVRGQTRYFGLPEHSDTLHYGREARTFTRRELASPFRLYTAYATAPGRSVAARVYAFVETAGGHDLGVKLVENGLARAYGVRRGTPSGIAHDEWQAMLMDLESGAMLDRRGIWSAAESQRLVAMRAEDRRERAELRSVGFADRQPAPVNLNTAPPESLIRLPGVGSVTADRIVKHRPYRDESDLRRIPRLSATARASLETYAVWETESE